ncbi:MAG TPA: sugar phosphate isomerase/epimerase family protein [Bacteroidia bacterium]|nr:sugar phosphate isomerase/epimerase family protein [Bacteroidia bacterium]
MCSLGVAPAGDLWAAKDPYPRSGKGLQVGLAAYSFRDYFEYSRGKRNAKYDEAGDRRMDMPKFIRYCAEHGAKTAELTSYFFPPDAGAEAFRECREVAEAAGIVISGTAVGNNFSHPIGSAEQTEQIAHVKEWIDNANLMGAPHIRIFAGVPPKGVEGDDADRNVIDALEKAAVYAAEKQVYLGIENHDSVSTAERLLRLVRSVESPWVGVNLDGGNFIADDVYAEIAASVPYAVNVQLKTEIKIEGGKKKVPADLERIVKILRDGGYEGAVVLEFEEAVDPYEHVPPLLEQLRGWCS